ncbi:uncharacterized protein LOC124815196 [Hydra vulgaris]|uniref:uncharacterized protein LOC124815196 n=1 Tax=Hydra vulgaris TaxID=6087 RepID=UPI001F5EDAD6|nr:uncharacterized protein LOC124815196 [Hydra vulgaris]
MRWRMSLSPYDIHDRRGQCNSDPDRFTRVRCAAISSESLYDLHTALCHLGVIRLHHFIRSRNLPYLAEDVKQICPLPFSTPEQYMLTILDEYSRFPFAYSVKDMTTQTIINCLTDLFSMFGMASYVHSDRGTSLMSS